MWPLLAELGVALLKQDANNREYADEQRRHAAQTKMDIMGMRAARAGDSGYMQRALGAARSYPHNPDNGANMLLGVVAGLLKQKGAMDAEDAASAATSGTSGSSLNDVDNLFGGRRVTDDDLLNDW